MKILITGACGFAGRALAEAMLGQRSGLEIVAFDNLSRPGSEQNRDALRALGIPVIHGDLRMASDVMELPKADWVVEAAANPSVLAGVGSGVSSRQLMEHNLRGTLEILEYAKLHRAGVVLISSSRVYSIEALCSIALKTVDEAFVPADETLTGIGPEFSVEMPVSLYGSSKLASEIVALEYGATFGFPVWVNRCGVLAGAGQFGTPGQGIFAYWLNAHLRRRSLKYIGFEGTGYQSRDAMHPSDLARLILLQIDTARAGGRRTYTAGGGPENLMSLAQLTRWCDARFGRHPIAADSTPRPFDVPWVAMDNRWAQADFEWFPTIQIQSILEEIASHAIEHPRWLEMSEAR